MHSAPPQSAREKRKWCGLCGRYGLAQQMGSASAALPSAVSTSPKRTSAATRLGCPGESLFLANVDRLTEERLGAGGVTLKNSGFREVDHSRHGLRIFVTVKLVSHVEYLAGIALGRGVVSAIELQ